MAGPMCSAGSETKSLTLPGLRDCSCYFEDRVARPRTKVNLKSQEEKSSSVHGNILTDVAAMPDTMSLRLSMLPDRHLFN